MPSQRRQPRDELAGADPFAVVADQHDVDLRQEPLDGLRHPLRQFLADGTNALPIYANHLLLWMTALRAAKEPQLGRGRPFGVDQRAVGDRLALLEQLAD